LGAPPCAGAASRAADRPPAELPPAARIQVDFVRDIKPIFEKSCVGCHGAVKQRASLRLDQAKAALAGGNSGAVIKPGDAAGSRLLKAVAGLDADLKIPPDGKTPF